MLKNRIIFLVAVAVTAHVASTSEARAETFDQYISQFGGAKVANSTWLDGCDVLITPSGEVRTPCTLSRADLVGGVTNASLNAVKVKVSNIPTTSLAWREATVQVTADHKVVGEFSLVEVLELAGTASKPKGHGTVKVQIWRRLQSDVTVAARVKSGKITTPIVPEYTAPTAAIVPAPEWGDDTSMLSGDVRKKVSVEIDHALRKGLEAGAVLFGSAGERLNGKAGAKTLRKWAINFVQEGNIASGGDDVMQWAVTRVNGTARNGPIPYWLMVVNVAQENRRGQQRGKLALAIFGVAQ